MKAIEFESQLNIDGTLSVPPEVVSQVPPGEALRVLIVLQKSDEEADWVRLTTEQFLKGYAESDAVYDELQSG